MKRLAVVVLAMLAGASSSQAEPAEKWEGFKRAEEVKPSFLPFLRDSVVIIETAGAFIRRKPSARPDQWVDVDKIKPYTGKALIKDRRRFQIESCRRAGLKKCPVMNRTTFATGFILNGDTLYMCRHPFHNFVAWASAANGVAVDKVEIPLRIRTVSGKLLYDSSRVREGQQLAFKTFNRDSRINRPIDVSTSFPTPTLAFNAKASDIAVFKSARPLGVVSAPAVKNTVSQLSLGEEAYLFGFPDPVKGYAGGRVTGKELAGSHGYALELIKERGSMRFSNYSHVGMSGAPLISPDGTILGMSCGSFGLENKVSKPGEVNATAITLDPTALENLWQGLNYE
jgi:hypothetical protein